MEECWITLTGGTAIRARNSRDVFLREVLIHKAHGWVDVVDHADRIRTIQICHILEVMDV